METLKELDEIAKQILNGFIASQMEWNYIMHSSCCEFARMVGAEHLNWFDGE